MTDLEKDRIAAVRKVLSDLGLDLAASAPVLIKRIEKEGFVLIRGPRGP